MHISLEFDDIYKNNRNEKWQIKPSATLKYIILKPKETYALNTINEETQALHCRCN